MAAVVEGTLRGYIFVLNKIFYFTHEMKHGTPGVSGASGAPAPRSPQCL